MWRVGREADLHTRLRSTRRGRELLVCPGQPGLRTGGVPGQELQEHDRAQIGRTQQVQMPQGVRDIAHGNRPSLLQRANRVGTGLTGTVAGAVAGHDDRLHPGHKALTEGELSREVRELEMAMRIHEAGEEHPRAEVAERTVGCAGIAVSSHPHHAIVFNCDAAVAQRWAVHRKNPGGAQGQSRHRPTILEALARPPRTRAFTLAVLATTALVAGCGRAGREASPSRSVILIVLDAASVRHFGAYGYGEGATPEIDRLAATGDVFLNASSPAPYTRAAMVSLWTSREPGAKGALEAPRLAERLSAHGIHTAGFVGNPNAGPAYSFDRGFSEFHEAYTDGAQAESFRPLLRQFLSESGNRRFFAYVHYREPHVPYDPPAPFAERFPLEKLPRRAATDKRFLDSVCGRTGGPTSEDRRDLARLYDANLAYVDAEVGWLWRQVVETGLAETTAIAITSDHGEALCEHGFVGHNLQVYDESVHVPLIVRRPGGSRSRRHEALVSLLDVAPTILGLFGLGEGGTPFEGRDLLAEEAGGAPSRVVFSRSATEPPAFALRDEDFAFIYQPSLDKTELFDRRRDPVELHNIADEHPELAERDRAEVLKRVERLSDPIVPPATAKTPELLEQLEALGYVESSP